MKSIEQGKSDGDRRVDEALADYYRLIDHGQAIDLDEFVSAHPEHSEQLSELLETVRLIETMAGPVEASGNDGSWTDKREPVAGVTAPPGGEEADLDATVSFNPRGREGPSFQPDERKIDRRFGEYEELTPIGQGGMGVVYRAHQASLNREVALKMIRAGVLASDRDVERFYVEARAAAKLNHPNIVKVYEVGEREGHHYFAMELVEGTDLAKLINSEIELSSRQIARLILKAAEAIQHAHECQVVHRDLKPANILIDQRGRPMVSDFGLAKDASEDRGLTSDGSSLGTPSYMSPEQAAGRLDDVGPASDIYSLGAILYELLAGRPPFKAKTTVDTILDAIHKAPVAPRVLNRTADKLLEAICLKCLHKDPRQRYSTAKALADDLSRYLEGRAITARPRTPLQKTWHWLREVPLIAAIVGRRVTHPSVAHRTVQWAAVVGLCALIATPLLWGTELPYPSAIRIAAGHSGGEYFSFGQELGRLLAADGSTVEKLQPTAGSRANRELLLAGDADVALLQASVFSGRTDDIAVVAPLFQEYVLVVVPVESSIESIADLQGKQVLVGDADSGMQQSARQLFDLLSISPNAVTSDFRNLQSKKFDAAIVTSGVKSASLASLFESGQFRLAPWTSQEIDNVSELDLFTTRALVANAIANGVPREDMRCVSTRTYLVVPRNASSEFALDLFHSVEQLADNYELASIRNRDEWGLAPIHPAVSSYLGSFQDASRDD